MSEQDNVRVAIAAFDALNAHDLSRSVGLQAAGYQAEAPGAPGPMSGEQERMYIQEFLTAFPDLHFDVTRTIAQGDFVVVNWVGTGTHTGPMRTPTGGSIPATGKKATTQGSTTSEIKNGKLTRTWQYWDMATLLAQLGLLPPM